jgi:hypothetical protein
MYTPEGLEMMKTNSPLRNSEGNPVNTLSATYIEWMKAKHLQVADWSALEDFEDNEDVRTSVEGDPSQVINPSLDDISEILKEL